MNQWLGIDLVIVDCQKNLPMLGASSPPTVILVWNVDKGYEALQFAYFFAKKHLQDHCCLIVIHSYSTNSKANFAALRDVLDVDKEGMDGHELTSLDFDL